MWCFLRWACVILLLLVIDMRAVWAAGPDIDPAPHSSGYPGYYIGGKIGDGMVSESSVTADGVDFFAHNGSGVAGGIYVGYKFQPYIALELGYDVFSTYSYSANLSSFVNASTNIRRSLSDLDVLLRLIAPWSPFYVTAAGGLAVVMSSYAGIGTNGDSTFAEPKAEVGIGCYVSHLVSIGVSFSRIFGGGNFSPSVNVSSAGSFLSVNKNTLPNMDLAAVNVTVDL